MDSQERSQDFRQEPKKKFSFAGVAVVSATFGFVAAAIVGGGVYWKLNQEIELLRLALPAAQRLTAEQQASGEYIPQTTQEEKIIQAVKQVSPAVVSIVLTKDVPVFERVFRDPFEEFFGGPSPLQIPEVQQRGVEQREVGQGSGFFVSADGLVVTNKHVVLDDDVAYTVFTKEGKSYEAKVLARDPVQDLAVLRVRPEQGESFPFVRLGSSDVLQIGQTAVAIGNSLGEFRNTVSTGVISGLGRTITASDGGEFVETIEDVIQTDAAINRGNSGGPLLNLAGEVIGVNTATVLDAQSIGFAIPVNIVKRDVEQVQTGGAIVYPFLGVHYVLVTKQIQQENNLFPDHGAFISSGDESSPIVPDSAAEKAGLQDGDVITHVNGKKITTENSLAKELQKYKPEDTIEITVHRSGQELKMQVTLGERTE